MDSRATTIYGFIGAFFPLAIGTVCLRFYTRIRFNHIDKDDVAILVSLILYTGLVIATVYAIKYGLGLHIWDVVPANAVNMQKCGFSSQVLYPPALGAVKLSVVLFILRVLPIFHNWITPLYCFAAWIVLEEAAFTISLFFQCRPINYYWDKTAQGSCFNQPAFYYADASFNMVTDILILAIPWIIFRKLRVSKARKYGILLLCSVGVFTLAASTVRLPYLRKLNISEDPTWHVVDICIWSIAELGSAITLTSVPAIMPLVRYFFPKFMAANPGMTPRRIPGMYSQPDSIPFKNSTPTVNNDDSTRCLQQEEVEVLT